MSTVSHQTIKISKGKHSAPTDGACVMELASMLAGERFTDHPQSVCPAIGSFLRAYNDAVEDDRRQDLYAYAARVVGTRASAEVERERAERLLDWAAQRNARRWARVLPRPLRSFGSNLRPPIDACGTHAVRTIRRHTDASHAEALALIDELMAIGAPSEGSQPEAPRSGRSEVVSIS